jgi:hypothetical protein
VVQAFHPDMPPSPVPGQEGGRRVKIDTTLRQWCGHCQRATVTRICYSCWGQPAVCSDCHNCYDEEEED